MAIPEQMCELALDEDFSFSCYPGISCFNACCRDLNQFLTPYNTFNNVMMAVIALKNQCMQEPLPAGIAALLYTAFYDLAMFLQLLMNDHLDLSWISVWPPEADRVSDERLLRFSYGFVWEKILQRAEISEKELGFPEITEIAGDADGA
ncbi:MAG: hypothetical protein R6X08_08235 [Desulfosalsimonadaceae bacterium]